MPGSRRLRRLVAQLDEHSGHQHAGHVVLADDRVYELDLRPRATTTGSAATTTTTATASAPPEVPEDQDAQALGEAERPTAASQHPERAFVIDVTGGERLTPAVDLPCRRASAVELTVHNRDQAPHTVALSGAATHRDASSSPRAPGRDSS